MTKENGNANQKELQTLYNESGAAKAILDHFASRERNWSETTVDRLRWNLEQDGHGISRGDVIETFRRLENLDCGRFIPGRKGHASRFKWSVGLVAVGQAAAGESVKIEPTPANTPSEPPDDLLEHRFRLRKAVDVSFRLPADLKAAEAARLAAFIQTLPFDGTEAATT